MLVIENALADGRPDPRGRTLDITILAVTGGRERTVVELSALLQPAGFTAGRIIETAGPMSIAEATAL